MDHVRELLEELQGSVRRSRAWLKVRREAFAEIRRDKREVDCHLRAFGLRMHGYQIRGWRVARRLGVRD